MSGRSKGIGVFIGAFLLAEACGALSGVAFSLGGDHYHHPILMGVVVGAIAGLVLGVFAAVDGV